MSVEAMKQALEALDMACAKYGDVGNMWTDWPKWDAAATALRQAIKQDALNGLAATSREIENVPCKDHPDAPHGFMRDESHSSGRYVCECEAWEPDDMSIKPKNIDTKPAHADGVDIDLLHQSEQEGWRWARECEAEVKRLKDIIDELENDDLPKREWFGLTGLEVSHYNSRLSRSGVAEDIEFILRERNT
jgi:hypothetical protein